MPKYAVGYLYTPVPKYDRIETKGDIVHLYTKGKMVYQYSADAGYSYATFPPSRVGVVIIEANNIPDAADKLREEVSYHIDKMSFLELEEKDV